MDDDRTLGVSDDTLVAEGMRSVRDLSILFFDTQMRIHAVHGGATLRHGYEPAGMVGRRAPDVLPAAVWAVLGPLYARALSGETVQVTAESNDGTAVYETTFQPIVRDGVTTGGMAVSRDVTAQRRAEEALRRSEREFRLLAEESTDVIVRCTPGGEVRYVSAAVERILGVRPEDGIGQPIGGHVHPDDLPRATGAWDRVVTERRQTGVELRMRRPDGGTVWLEWELHAVVDPASGQVTEVQGAGRDVTHRRAADDLDRQWELCFATMTRGVAWIDPDTDLIQRVNPACAQMHGGTPEEYVGRPLSSVFSAESSVRLPEVAQALRRAGTVRYRSHHVRDDGSTFPVSTEVFSARDADGRLLYRLAFLEDLTDPREPGSSEQHAVALFERSFQHAPVGMLLFRGPVIQRANAAIGRLLGMAPHELAGRQGTEFVHPDDVEKSRMTAVHAAGGAEVAPQRRRLVTASGEVRSVEVRYSLLEDDPELPTVLVHVLDRTASEAAEHDRAAAQAAAEQMRLQLAETSSLLQAVLEHSPLAIYLIGADGRWRLANEETAGIVGVPADQLIGRTLEETVPPSAVATLEAGQRHIAAEGGVLEVDETYVDARTGLPHRFVSLRFPVLDEGGETLGVGGVSIDVTERERAQRELTAARDLFEAAFQEAPVGKLITRERPDGTSVVVNCNAAFAELIGATPEEVVGRAGPVAVHPADLPEHERMLEELRAGRRTSGELRLRHRDGHDIWTHTAPAMVRSAEGEALVVTQVLDISERKQFEDRMRYLADHDALTGTYSRRRFEEELAREAARITRHGGVSCLLLLDLDGFKHVNDSFGHSAGDTLLTRIGGALTATLREVDVLARIGGDEFAVILTDTDIAGARTAAGKLLDAVRTHGRLARSDTYAEVTASIGATMITATGGVDAEELLVEADIAMYEAKDAGRDQLAVFDRIEGQRDKLVRRTDWIGRLRRALRDERFVLHAQPVVPLLDPPVPGEHFELLVRLQDDDGRLLPPDAFLRHAERHGIILDIDRWVLREAVGHLHRAWRDGRDLSLAVNFSARTVQDPRIVGDLAQMLCEQPIARHSLMIEVTETAAITNVARAAELARQLRDLGCRLGLDDFGTGFASFYYLKHLVFDVLKIDGDFIDRLPTSSTDQLVVRAVVDIARGLGARLIAERVSDQATVELLAELGVDYGQGHFLGRPEPLPDWDA
jgi:diguanylate cyclase (GGDEF)-like protein/PAS domain S-box-containing protein